MLEVSCLDEDLGLGLRMLVLRCGVRGVVLKWGGDEEAGAWQACVWVCTDARACRDGQSPVWAASFGGHVSCVEALIRANADVLQCDK